MHRKPRHVLSTLLIALMGLLIGVQVQWPDAMISALSWSPDGQYVASGNSEGTFIVQNLLSGESVEFTMGLIDPNLTEILWKNETQLLAVASSGDAQLWDLPTRTLKQKFYTRYGMGKAIWTKDGTHFLSGGEFGVALNLWNAETGEIVSSSEEGGTIGALA